MTKSPPLSRHTLPAMAPKMTSSKRIKKRSRPTRSFWRRVPSRATPLCQPRSRMISLSRKVVRRFRTVISGYDGCELSRPMAVLVTVRAGADQ
jgi:hypothetical protein